MPIQLDDKQIAALIEGKANIADFMPQTQQASPQLRSIKEDTILLKNALARMVESQLSMHMKSMKDCSNIVRLQKVNLVFSVVIILFQLGLVMFLYSAGVI